ncbi:MAG: penicillin acylase family protein [Myxococcales bacterium]|nr:penicillin acylase family protein [Myxococcales bacterium]MCB9644571.1 penicillin acylase family protein [Myxococcales bacterium]
MPEIIHPAGEIFYTRDSLGVPSIQAKDQLQSAYARGYLHACDRLVQIELNRMASEGRLMEILGDLPFARLVDRCVRALDFSANLEQQWESLDEWTQSLFESYCEGFAVGARERGRPMILRLLGVKPRAYKPLDIIRMYRFTGYMALGSIQHLAEALVLELVGEGAPRSLLDMMLGDSVGDLDEEMLRQVRVMELDKLLIPLGLGGSNAFAVSAERSASGHALLMGEFHMETGQLPPLLYALHAETKKDGRFYQGMGIPGLPFLSGGRNDQVGWSYTNAHGDNIDMLIERCKDGRYLADGEWRDFTLRREEVVKIRGKKTETWVFYENPYGTLLGDPHQEGDYPCLRWTGMRDGTVGDIYVITNMLQCHSVKEGMEIHRKGQMLGVWCVLADRQGNIGVIKSGAVDKRPDGWTGTYPRQAWDLATRDFEHLSKDVTPQSYNPEEGVIVSANERRDGLDGSRWINLPEPHYRFERLGEILARRDKHTLRSLAEASYDEIDRCASRMMKVWAPLLPEDEAFQELGRWALEQEPIRDRALHRQQMALFHAVHHELLHEVLLSSLNAKKAHHLLHDVTFGLCFQYHFDQAFALEKPELLDAERLTKWLKVAWKKAQTCVAEGRWTLPPRFGFSNQITQGSTPSWLGWDTKPYDIPGGPTVPFQSRVMRLLEHPMLGGPSFHMVMDMSHDGSWYNMPGGASERRLGPGYGKGIEEWIEGRFLPFGQPKGEAPNLS